MAACDGPYPACLLDHTAPAAEAVRDLLGDLRLDSEQIFVGPVPAVRPQMFAGCRVEELRSDAQPAGPAQDRALNQETHPERFADLGRGD